MNDTLSYITPLETDEEIEPYPFTDTCPLCNGDVYINENETYAFCGNEACTGKTVGRVERFLTKLDIKGVRYGTLDKLHEYGLLNSISDLYNLDYEEVSKVPGLGKRSGEVIQEALDAKGEIYDYELIAGLGIEDFGNTSSKLLCKNITLNDLLFKVNDNRYYETEDFYNTMNEMEGFKQITVDKFVDGMKKYEDDLMSLLDSINNIVVFKDELETNASSESYTFSITGSINNWKNRNELKKELELKGHKVTGSVSKNTDYLINNDVESSSSKNKRAKELNVPIITEDELIALM